MSGTKTKPTKVTVKDFIARIENDTRRRDAVTLLRLFEKVTGWKARMWGPSIVGFGRYQYTYESGHSGELCVVGFSPRKANLVIYQFPDRSGKTQALLRKLGKHKGGVDSCLYVNKLADVDLEVLEKVIKLGVGSLRFLAAEKNWPVSAQ